MIYIISTGDSWSKSSVVMYWNILKGAVLVFGSDMLLVILSIAMASWADLFSTISSQDFAF